MRARSVHAAFVLLLAAGGPACAQSPHDHPVNSNALPMPTLTFPGDSAVVERPFATDRNHIVLQATVGGAGPLRCALDTGARGTVIFGDSVVNAAGLQPSGLARIRGAGGGDSTVAGKLFMGTDVVVAGLKLSGLMVVAMPDEAIRRSPLFGSMAIGRGLLEQVVAEIDWDTQRIRFHDPAKFHYEGRGVSVPLTFDALGQAYVDIRVALSPDSAFDAHVVLDTGASHTLSLEPGTDPHIRVPEGAEKRRIGIGASGVVTGAVGRAASVELGGVTFHDVPVTFPDASLGLDVRANRVGNLGSGLLRRFRVYLDLKGKRMILEPGPHVKDPLELPPY
jgi:predicted aspartyl protease